MKILVLCEYIKNFRELNSYRVRWLSAVAMAEKGHEIVFASPSPISNGLSRTHKMVNLTEAISPGLFPKRLRVGGFSLLDAFFKTKIVIEHDFDVIYATNGHRIAQFIPCLIGKLIKKCIIVNECWEWLGQGGYADKRKKKIGKVVSFYDRCLELRVQPFFDHIFTITSTLKNRFKYKDNITVLYGGAENLNLQIYNMGEVRKALQLDPDAFIIGMSNVVEADHQDNHIFFKAFQKLFQEYPKIYLLVTGSDQAYIDKVKRMYRISQRVIFPGWIDFRTYNKYLSSCNVFVMPYPKNNINAGRWPNKIGDYLCLDRPIITNPTGDIGEIFKSFLLGFLCDDSPEGFYNTLKKIIENQISLKKASSDAQYLVTDHLSFDKRIDKIIQIFNEKVESDRYHRPHP